MPSLAAAPPPVDTTPVTRPADSADEGLLPVALQSAMRQDIQASPKQKSAVLARVGTIKTRAQAMEYLREVQQKVRTRRAAQG